MINKWLIIASTVIMFFACENGTDSNDEDSNSIIDIGSLGIHTHQDNEYQSDVSQYEFDIWESGVHEYFQCAIFYANDPSITIPEDGTYNIDSTMDNVGDFSFLYNIYQKSYIGTSGSITISNSDIANGTYTFTANNVHTVTYDINNSIGTATFIGTINVTP